MTATMRIIIPADENPALRKESRPLMHAEITGPRIRTLIADMKELLSHEEYGVALAAPQVGEALRLFIVSGHALSKRRGKTSDDAEASGEPVEAPVVPDQVYINPSITKMSRGKKEKHEGCLSIRGKWGMVPRAEKVTLTAFDEDGRPITRGASGFLAHIFQHEMDHLEGILYTDKAVAVYDEKES